MSDPILRESDRENLAGMDTGRETLSHTKLSKLLSCHRLYELHYEQRLERIDKRESLEMGKAFQKAIEHQDADAAPLVLDGYVENRQMSATGVVWERPPELPIFHTQEAADRHEINKAVVRAAAALYLRKWPAPASEHREFEFVVRLRNPWTGHYSRTFDLHGYADGIVGGFEDHREPLPLELVENKLVSRVDSIMVQRLPLDRQLQLLRYGVWRATGRTVGTVHFRWVKKPSIKPRQKESIPEFCARLAADYEKREDFYAYQPPASYITSADLLEIEKDLWMWAQRLRNARRSQHYDRNTSVCSDYGGCQFLPICSGDPDAMSLYQKRPERKTA